MPGMARKEFKARLEGVGPGGAWTALKVPFSVERTWGTRARLAVRGAVNGFPFRSSIFPTGDGTHLLMVNKAVQSGANAVRGDLVSVLMEPDTDPRTVTVPRELKAALARQPGARAAFERLPLSHRREYVDWIVEAKQAEARARRIEKAVSTLRQGRKAR